MDYKTYHNCLRMQITVDDNQDDRIEAVAKHCAKYGFDNVMLMLNTEEFFDGHITIDELKVIIKLLKKASKRLSEYGISTSINNWFEMGHVDRGRKLREGQNFVTLIDINGRESTVSACPLSEEWLKYFEEYIKTLVSSVDTDTYWIEDDFRVHNHPPLSDIGCYCSLHMKYYNEKLGTNYTREEFIEKAFAKGPLNKEREVFLDANRDIMIATADRLAKAVKSASPKTDVALMSSPPAIHCVEARDWNKLLSAFGQGGKRINRIHLPYFEPSGKDALYYFNSVSMGVRAMHDDDVIIMPETECGSSCLYGRGARYLKYNLEFSTPLILSGMTYSIYDFVGNGVRESYGFGEIVRDLQPFMQAILDLDIKFSSGSGVIVPVDVRASYYKTIDKKGWRDLLPTEFNVGAYLNAIGIAYKYSREKDFENQTIFLSGSSVDYFTDEQVKSLFEKNFVMIDGACALKLKDRNLLSLISATDAVLRPVDTGYQSYEQCEGDLYIDGIKNLRASCRARGGDFVEVKYNDGVDVKTCVYNEKQVNLAPSIVYGKNFMVFPFFLDDNRPSLYCDLRPYFATDFVKNQNNDFVVCDKHGVSPYLYEKDGKKILFVTNSNYDNYLDFGLTVGFDFNKVKLLNKQGKIRPVKFKKDGKHVTIKVPLEYLSTNVFIFE